MNFFESLNDFLEAFTPASIVIRLVLSTVCGGVIGIEREKKRHSAGFRTFTLVCLGSALATIVNIYLWKVTGSADVSRIPAGVVSGVGFLGVGTIIVTRKNMVKGLTTAAGLWATACLGLALGAGMVVTGVLTFLLIVLTMGILSNISKYIGSHNQLISLYVELEKESNMKVLHEYTDSKGFSIISMERKREMISKNCDLTMMVDIDLKQKYLHSDVIHDVSRLEGVFYVEEIHG